MTLNKLYDIAIYSVIHEIPIDIVDVKNAYDSFDKLYPFVILHTKDKHYIFTKWVYYDL